MKFKPSFRFTFEKITRPFFLNVQIKLVNFLPPFFFSYIYDGTRWVDENDKLEPIRIFREMFLKYLDSLEQLSRIWRKKKK